jgi:hypothetical protein
MTAATSSNMVARMVRVCVKYEPRRASSRAQDCKIRVDDMLKRPAPRGDKSVPVQWSTLRYQKNLQQASQIFYSRMFNPLNTFSKSLIRFPRSGAKKTICMGLH